MGLRDKAREAAQKAAELANERARQAMAGRPDPPTAEVPPLATTDPTKPLFIGTSHDSGRNAQVTLYRDRIERVKERSMTSLSRAKQDTEVTPVKAVSSVQARRTAFAPM